MSLRTCSNLPLITPRHSIRETMTLIDEWAKGIALVVDEERRLIVVGVPARIVKRVEE